jgi:hypothetical protein
VPVVRHPMRTRKNRVDSIGIPETGFLDAGAPAGIVKIWNLHITAACNDNDGLVRCTLMIG